MSCRVIRTGETETSRPLFVSGPRAGREQPWAPPETGAPVEEDHSAEIEVLRDRIRQLEANLPAQLDQARRTGVQEGESSGMERAMASTRPVLEKLAKTIAEIAGL